MEYLTTATVWQVTLFSLGMVTTVVAFWLGTQALFPHFIRRAQEAYSRPWLVAGLGIGGVATVALLLTILTKIGHGGQQLGALIGAVGVVLALAGSAGLARRIGTGMLSPLDKEQPWRRTLRGGITLGLLLPVPFLNFITAPAVLLMGLGAAILALHRQRKERKEKARDQETEILGDHGADE